VTTANHSTHRAAWLFPGRITLALVANWRHPSLEAGLHELMIARERERGTDLSLIAGLRQLSAKCSLALTRCRTAEEAASG
jgi:hypothetical protein